MIKKYGVEHALQCDKFLKQSQNTLYSHYGVYFTAHSKEIFNKGVETKIEKYGSINHIDKIKQTNLEKYGSVSPFGNKVVRNKSQNTFIKKYGSKTFVESDKFKNVCLEKYGVENPSYSQKLLEKIKQTNLKKYGETSYTKTKEFQNKSYQTKKKNNSLGKSKEEDKIYELLLIKFPNTIHHYKSDKYPFPCDFYIPSEDLYIEYQGFWMHGKEPYTGLKEQKEKVKLWESKNTIQYIRAIDTWTQRDVLKRNTAKKNNLNWIEFFNMNQFMNWYSK